MIAAIEVTRPHNGVLTFLSVILGGLLAHPDVSGTLLAAGAAAALVASGGYVLNDVCGLAADAVNRPHRPIPSGRLSRRTAAIESALLLLGGLLLGVGLPSPVPQLTLGAALALVAYNLKLQRVPAAGNLLVAGLGALAFLYGGAAAGTMGPAVVPACFAFIYHLGREVLKDAEDCAGDRHLGGSNLALRWGDAAARRIAAACCVAVVALSPLPVLRVGYGALYLCLMLVLNGLLLDVAGSVASPGPVDYRALNRLLKLGMPIGLAAVFGDQLL